VKIFIEGFMSQWSKPMSAEADTGQNPVKGVKKLKK